MQYLSKHTYHLIIHISFVVAGCIHIVFTEMDVSFYLTYLFMKLKLE